MPQPKILDDIMQAVGNTPLVRLRSVGRETGCEILAKCEFMNPGGSIKDRIAKRMLEVAESTGRVKKGDTLIEATSGNTGIGLAMAAAVAGYRMVITMPQKMSREKQVVLEALGAEIIRTPTEAAWDSPESHIGVAKQLQALLPDAHILDQYGNPENPRAHEETTAREIVEACDGRLDAFVATAGTGGTLTGVARYLKQHVPSCRIVGVDPVGSILAGPGPIAPYKVEGIGYDFIPDVLDRSLVDEWVKTEDRPSFHMARRLIRQEGLLCGGSCGSATWAAVEVARRMGPGKRVVVILADGVRNYMSKFLDDRWMRENGLSETTWESLSVGDIVSRLPPKALVTAQGGDTVGQVVARMKERGISQVPVLEGERLAGIVTESDVLTRLVEGHATAHTKVAEVMVRNVTTIGTDAPAGHLTELFAQDLAGLVVDRHKRLLTIVTKMDMVEALSGMRRVAGA